ncbi:MAG: GMC family oxidoreductase [Thermomicrobiales bacterium]
MNSQLDADVVIVGSGVAGALIATRLAAAGAKVRVLEAGPRTDRAAAVTRYRSGQYAYESPEWAPQPTTSNLDYYYIQNGPVKFSSDYERRVGGTTWHWLGNCPRLLPSDFQMKTRFGVGVDWPISYDDLEPWYVDAEHELGVSGNSEHNDGSPRSAPYPMPGLPFASGDKMFQEAAKSLGLELLQTPQARNAEPDYQGRPQCCGNATCIPVCPVQAKYDATYHLDLAEKAGVEITENAVVYNVVAGADGAVSMVQYKDQTGASHDVTGKLFVIAANGIETPKLLLISKGEYSAKGIANSSDQVGRHLADHPEARVSAVVPKPYAGYRGPLQLSGIDSVREGDFRSTRGAIRLQVSHSVGSPMNAARDLIAKGLVGKALWDEIAKVAPYQVRLASMIEQLPDENNRVTVDDTQVDALGIPRPVLTYSIDDYVNGGWKAANELHDQMLKAVGATDIVHAEELGGVGHLMGTVRMGDDPATSVADGFGRTHDHQNLYLAGSGLFPTTGTANPTLTIAALALRSAAEITKALGLTPVATPSASPASPVATPVG